MQAPQPRELPEAACAAVETVLGMPVCVHDHLGLLIPFLPSRRTHHLHPPCSQVKTQRQDACTAFDHTGLMRRAAAHPEGLVKRCHAGIVEWVMPVMADGRHWLTIYAGPRAAGAGLAIDYAAAVDRTGFWSPLVDALAPVGRDEAAAVMEILRQLAARLDAWRTVHLPRLAAPPDEHWKRSRQAEILAWVVARHREDVGIGDLAIHLHLSPDRVRHAVHELCGEGLGDLLSRERLATARELLTRTDMPVAAVATASGFRNRTHFHAVFQDAMGQSPGRWRAQARTRPTG